MLDFILVIFVVFLLQFLGAVLLAFSLTPPVNLSISADNVATVPTIADIASRVASEKSDDRFSNVSSWLMISGVFASGIFSGQGLSHVLGMIEHSKVFSLIGGIAFLAFFLAVMFPCAVRFIAFLRKRSPVISNW